MCTCVQMRHAHRNTSAFAPGTFAENPTATDVRSIVRAATNLTVTGFTLALLLLRHGIKYSVVVAWRKLQRPVTDNRYLLCWSLNVPHFIEHRYSIYFRVHKSSPLVCVLGQINPVHPLAYYLCNVCLNIILPFIPGSFK